MFIILQVHQTSKIMNDSKTYKISADLFKAVLENVYTKGQIHGYTSQEEAVKEAIKFIEDHQYIYEDRLTEEA